MLWAAKPIVAGALVAAAAAAWAEGFPRGHRDALGPRFEAAPQHRDGTRRPPRRGADSLERLLRWNQIAIDASGLDHTPVPPGEARVFGEQLGPGRSSRAIAIVHIAIFDAVNAIAGGYRGYTGLRPAPDDASIDAAIAQAAHDTLIALFPSQAATFDQELAEDLHEIRAGGRTKAQGIEVGRRAAAAILAQRAKDGSQHAEPRVGIDHVTSNQPGHWRQDPVSKIPARAGRALGRGEAVRAPVGAAVPRSAAARR